MPLDLMNRGIGYSITSWTVVTNAAEVNWVKEEEDELFRLNNIDNHASVLKIATALVTPLINNQSDLLNGEEREEPACLAIKEFGYESKRLWKITGPTMFMTLSQFSLGVVTQAFTGQVGDLELAAYSVENTVIAGLAFGIMLGMGSALETLSGQEYGAGNIRMLGVYMQRSWIILLTTGCLLVPVYVWSPPILHLIGETTEISKAAGKFAVWMLPQLFAFAMNFPIQKFLQSQRKVVAMAWIAGVVLALHVFFSWFLILKLGWGLTGAAVTLNSSWWLVVIGKLLYIFITKSDGAWSGFSWLAFSNLYEFFKLSLASGVMLCLQFWNLMILVVITGRLSNPLVPVDAISICLSIQGWVAMIFFGFNAAISVRVSNELGAGNAEAAKIAVFVVSPTAVAIGVVCMILVLCTRNYFPYVFTSSEAVAKETTKLASLLGCTVFLYSIQPILSGVAVGAGWQVMMAYINIGCFYIIGLPASILMGFKFKLGVEGIWSGMIGGIGLQTVILVVLTLRTNWKKEVEEAERRVRKWRGTAQEN